MSDRDGEQDPPSPEERGGKPPGHGQDLARELWKEVRGGARHFHLPGPRIPSGRVQQFFHGMSLPFHLARALLADPVAGKRYLRVGLLQTVAALTLALTCMGSGKQAAQKASERDRSAASERRAGAVRRLAEAAAARHVDAAEAEAVRNLREAGVSLREQKAGTRRSSRKDAGPTDGRPAEAEGAPLKTDAGEMDRQVLAEALADAGRPPVRSLEQRRAEAQARIDQRIRDLEAAAQGRDAGTSLAEAITALALEAARSSDLEDADANADAHASGSQDTRGAGDADGREAEDAHEDGGTAVVGARDTPRDGDRDAPRAPRETDPEQESLWRVKGFSLLDLPFWAALFAALQLAQWVVIALSHEHHDAISREASLLTGVEPEDDDIQPRIHVDMPWIRKKVKRRWRALLLFAMGIPAMTLLSIPFLCLCIGAGFSVLSTVWGAYWLAVFTAAKSGLAWEPPTEPHAPWFLRGWAWLTTRVPGLRWGLLQRYGAAWGRHTQEVIAPVATLERHPWVFAGLTVVRFINAFAPMKFFLRPLIPVAAAHLLAEEAAARAAIVPPPEKPAIPEGETGA